MKNVSRANVSFYCFSYISFNFFLRPFANNQSKNAELNFHFPFDVENNIFASTVTNAQRMYISIYVDDRRRVGIFAMVDEQKKERKELDFVQIDCTRQRNWQMFD